jgi:hypothetical protein
VPDDEILTRLSDLIRDLAAERDRLKRADPPDRRWTTLRVVIRHLEEARRAVLLHPEAED